MKIGTKHPTGFDALYSWVDSANGKWCMDMNDEEIGLIQEVTYMELCHQNGLNYFDGEPHPLIDSMMENIRWIEHAKRLGILRPRTKEERDEHNRSVL